MPAERRGSGSVCTKTSLPSGDRREPTNPGITRGTDRLVVVPSPSSPALPSPQQETVPFDSRVHVCSLPAVMAVTPVSPGTATGVFCEVFNGRSPPWPKRVTQPGSECCSLGVSGGPEVIARSVGPSRALEDRATSVGRHRSAATGGAVVPERGRPLSSSSDHCARAAFVRQ
jgi:hypothetical protein